MSDVNKNVEGNIKVRYGIAAVVSEDGNVVVKFIEGSEKEVKLQDAMGLLEIAKLQLVGSAALVNKNGGENSVE
jgi:hypothetical protein